MADEYAGKAAAVQNNWSTLSSQTPSAFTQSIFNALHHTDLHASTNPPPNSSSGHHVEVISAGAKNGEKNYRTLYFDRQLSQDEKNEIGVLYEQLKFAQASGEKPKQ